MEQCTALSQNLSLGLHNLRISACKIFTWTLWVIWSPVTPARVFATPVDRRGLYFFAHCWSVSIQLAMPCTFYIEVASRWGCSERFGLSAPRRHLIKWAPDGSLCQRQGLGGRFHEEGVPNSPGIDDLASWTLFTKMWSSLLLILPFIRN